MEKLFRFIKNKDVKKEPMEPVSVNLEKKQHKWVREKQLNLSMLVRAVLDKLMKGEDIDL